jgi:hypothetical protein
VEERKSHSGLILPGDPQFERKPSGFILVDDKEVASTIQCCHCDTHFISIKGSGHRRGFCTNCMKRTCGALKCDVCYPMLKKIEDYEKGKLGVLS